jgi:alanine racemase
MKLYRSQQLTRTDLQAHIYSSDLIGNIKALKSLCKPQTKFCAVVKSNAYGHGLAEITNILKDANVDFFAVAGIHEAIHLTFLDIKQPILIFEPLNKSLPPDLIYLCAKKQFHCSVTSLETMEFLQRILSGSDHILNLHINIETGMERCGLESSQAGRLIKLIDESQNAKLAGVYTHFASADEDDLSYSQQQLTTFIDFLQRNNLTERKDVIIHAANSAATLRIPEAHFDMVRCGISMYGCYPLQMANPPVKLKPVMKLQAPIVNLKKIPHGREVSYGCTFRTERETLAAVLPLGYADGFFRCFSNKAKMKAGDCTASVIGRVCMSQLIIDVTDVPDVAVGQMVTVIDNCLNSPCGAYALAELAGTICYEILASVPTYASRIVH